MPFVLNKRRDNIKCESAPGSVWVETQIGILTSLSEIFSVDIFCFVQPD